MSTGTQIDVVMPQMGVSVSEGTITRWLKQEGEAIAQDEPLLEISTDKVDTEVPSPGEGIVARILVGEGETVEVGAVLAVIAPAGTEVEAPAPAAPVPAVAPAPRVPEPAPAAAAFEPVTPAPAPAAPAPAAPAPAAPTPIAPAPTAPAPPSPPAAPAPAAPAPPPVPEPIAAEAPSGNGKTFISPVVARIAADHGVDPLRVPGTGTGGRVTKRDILAFIEASASMKAIQELAVAPAELVTPVAPVASAPPPAATPPVAPPPAAPPTAPPAAPPPAAAPPPPAGPPPAPAPVAATPEAPAPAPAAAAAPAVTPPAGPGPGETLEPITAMRRGVMEHMRRSLDTSAHVTTVFEVDMTRVVNLRAALKPEFAKQGVNLTYLGFIGRATVETLKNWPWLNGEIRGDRIVSKSFVNLGIAVALEGGKGLIVPVIRNAQDLNLLGIARAIADLAERARTKKLVPDDVQGGSFTITNPGGWGAIIGTPIISQPQVGILDVEALVKRPVVVTDELGNDSIAIRSMMNLCLSYDHRLVDGAYAAQFMKELRENLESWDETAY